MEDGCLIFWRPDRTVWINCWGDGKTPAQAETAEVIRAEANPDRRQILDEADGDMYRIVYALTEREHGEIRYAAYSFTIVEGEYLQLSAYFDSLEDQQWAITVATTPVYVRS